MDCPGCGAFNSRLDAQCADCGAQLSAAAQLPSTRGPSEADELLVDEASPDLTRFARRLAGAFMLLGSIPAAMVKAYAPGFQTPNVTILVLVTNVAFGLLLLAGVRQYVVPATIALAVLSLTGAWLAAPPALALLILVFPVCLLLLLIGRPSRRRVGTASLLFVTQTGAIVALYLAPTNPFFDGTIRVLDLGAAQDRIIGKSMAYELALPEGWRALKPSEPEPMADARVVHPATGAVLQVFVTRQDGARPTVAGHARTVARRVQNQVVPPQSLGPIPAYRERSRVLKLRWVEQGKKWAGLRAIVVGKGWAIEVSMSAPDLVFADREGQFLEVVRGLRLPEAELAPPEQVVPERSSVPLRPRAPLTLHFPPDLRDGWHAVNPATVSDAGIDSTDDFWANPYRDLVLALRTETNSDGEATAPAVIDSWVAHAGETRQNVRVVRRLQSEKRSAMVELEFRFGEAVRTVWLRVLVRDERLAFAVFEVRSEDKDEVATSGLELLRSVDFRKD